MNRAMKVGVWFALAAAIGLWSQSRGTGRRASDPPPSAKIVPNAPARH